MSRKGGGLRSCWMSKVRYIQAASKIDGPDCAVENVEEIRGLPGV